MPKNGLSLQCCFRCDMWDSVWKGGYERFKACAHRHEFSCESLLATAALDAATTQFGISASNRHPRIRAVSCSFASPSFRKAPTTTGRLQMASELQALSSREDLAQATTTIVHGMWMAGL